MNKHILIPLMSIMFVLSSCGSTTPKNSTEGEPEDHITEPKVESPILYYQGRIDTSDDSAPVIIWQGSTIEAEFTGQDYIKVGFSGLKGQVYFDIEIDGQIDTLKAENGWVDTRSIASGKHDVRLFKRSEADVGYVTFLGFKTETADGESTIFSPPDQSVESPYTFNRKFLFFGDSITAGACNEDPGEDQWEDYSTHNNALSYGAMTAESLEAEYRNISVSGMGITMGYNKLLFKEVWDRVYADASSAKVDFSLWQPDVIFTNFGENDDSYSSNQNQSFPSNFASEYISVVREIRNAYPDSTIVILRGGMYGGAQSERLRGPWQNAVNTLEAEDSNIKHFVFDHWSSKHPRVSDHRTMSRELTAWIKANLQ